MLHLEVLKIAVQPSFRPQYQICQVPQSKLCIQQKVLLNNTLLFYLLPANLTFDDVAGTPVLTKGALPPTSGPSEPVLLVASDAIMMSDAKDFPEPSEKHSGSAEILYICTN
jgi:hypothetical protein